MSQPAFPQLVHINGFPQTNEPKDAGMTLRDYFAAKAMQGICGNVKANATNADVARVAYIMADEMLKAREA